MPRQKKNFISKINFRPIEDESFEFYASILKYEGSYNAQIIDQHGVKMTVPIRGAIRSKSSKQRVVSNSFCLVSAGRIHLIYTEDIAMKYKIPHLFNKQDPFEFQYDDAESSCSTPSNEPDVDIDGI